MLEEEVQVFYKLNNREQKDIHKLSKLITSEYNKNLCLVKKILGSIEKNDNRLAKLIGKLKEVGSKLKCVTERNDFLNILKKWDNINREVKEELWNIYSKEFKKKENKKVRKEINIFIDENLKMIDDEINLKLKNNFFKKP